MRSRTSTWFECKVRYDQTQENGSEKKVTEQYVVDAESFTEAEKAIIAELTPYVHGEFEVTDVKKAPYKEVFFMDDGEKILANETEKLVHSINKGKGQEQFEKPTDFNADNADVKYYKAKLQFVTINEQTGKEKYTNAIYLVQACSLHSALNNIDAVMKGTMLDYIQASVSETKITDVFEDSITRIKAADLIEKMLGDMANTGKTTEEIVDMYVSAGSPELREKMIAKLRQKRVEMFGIDK